MLNKQQWGSICYGNGKFVAVAMMSNIAECTTAEVFTSNDIVLGSIETSHTHTVDDITDLNIINEIPTSLCV